MDEYNHLVDIMSRALKDLKASHMALLSLLGEKGILSTRDIPRYSQLKIGSLAQLDQVEAKVIDQLKKEFGDRFAGDAEKEFGDFDAPL